MLLDFSSSWSKVVKYVSLEGRKTAGSPGNALFNTKSLVMQSKLSNLVDQEIKQINTGYASNAEASRRKA